MFDKDVGTDHIIVALDCVVVDVKCGLHPWERHAERPNRLSISVKLYVPIGVGRLVDLGPIVDYDHIRDYIVSLEKAPHIDLLEEIADGIIDRCFADGRVSACWVSIRKPHIFAESGGAGIDVRRSRAFLGER
jgi:dihydroneopterin aldolase